MKNVLWMALAITLMTVGCADNEETFDLRLDGTNSSAPILDAGLYQSAARFTSTLTSPYEGLKLREVEFYILDIPSSCRVIIYDEGNSTSPGVVLYDSGDIISSIDGGQFNTHELSTPLELTGDDLWISIETNHPNSIRSVGCDTGPAVSNGDWVYSSTTQQWQTLRDFTGGLVDINWNIRGYLIEE